MHTLLATYIIGVITISGDAFIVDGHQGVQSEVSLTKASPVSCISCSWKHTYIINKDKELLVLTDSKSWLNQPKKVMSQKSDVEKETKFYQVSSGEINTFALSGNHTFHHIEFSSYM